jgi:hypothetical protein
MPDVEIRTFTDPVECRAEDGKVTATGTAIRYGALSKNMGGVVERIMPGAADNVLEGRNIVAYHEHNDRTKLLGSTGSGTLRLFNSPTELRYEIDLPDTTAGRDVAVLLERRDIAGASYGFLSNKAADKWSRHTDGLALRSVHEFKLFDHVALTCAPAYPSSSAELSMTLRSLADATGSDMAVLLDAAEHRELANLIDSAENRDEPPAVDERVLRPRMSWLL